MDSRVGVAGRIVFSDPSCYEDAGSFKKRMRVSAALLEWLDVEVKGAGNLFRFCTKLLVLDYILAFFAVWILARFGVYLSGRSSGTHLPWGLFFLVLLGSVFLEEVVFRFIPLVLAVKRWGASPKVLVVAVVVSAAFGFAHGGFAHIPVQGVGGLFLSVVFLKCGGFAGRFRKALAVSTLYHFVFDAILFAFVFLAS